MRSAQDESGHRQLQQGAAVNPMCPRLEAQLATIDRGGGGDPAKEEQIRRYQDAAAKQQGELDRVTSQAKRMGCDSSGFFSLFSGQSAQCGPVNNQIQQMRANLEQITTSLERLRGGGLGGAERENQRRSVLAALAQNNCGPQYANAARGPGNFLDNLFGNNNNNNPVAPPSADLGPQSGTYRTVCVRTCDGVLFPDLVRDRPCPVSRRRKDLQESLPGGGSDAVRLPQSRRRHEPGGVDQRPALFVVAECVSLPSGVQSVLRLQGGRTDLVRRAENHRRQSQRRTAGRHHRHRREREENVARAVAKAAPAAAKKGDSAGRGTTATRACARSHHGGHRAGDRYLQRTTSRSARWARPLSPPADPASPRTLPPIRGSRGTPGSRRVRAAACRHRETCW